MKLQTKFSLAGLGLASAGVGLTAWLSSMRWQRKTAQLIEKLVKPVSAHGPKIVTFEGFDQLPAPVAKYLRFALKEGQPLIRSVRISQVGELRAIATSQDGWMPFKAVQFISSQPPGFVWDARLRPSPWMLIQVRDAYVDGQGAAQVSAFSLVTVAEAQAGAELRAGALMRYLAEAVWCPTALLPTANLVWSPLSDTKALATLTDAGTTVALEFCFNEVGEITGVYTPGRHREVNGKYELTPWSGHHHSYEARAGMMVPTAGDVEWHLPSGIFSAWKGRAVKSEYRFVS